MIADFEDFVTWMYVVIDDLWQPIAAQYPRPGPAPTVCSDSELITIVLVSACRGWEGETAICRAWQPYRSLFPRLPERSWLNRRRRHLAGAINHLRQIILRLLDVAADAHAAIDSLPISVVAFHLAPARNRDWDAAGASYGYCPSKKQAFFGYRLHLLVTLGGVILDFVLTDAAGDERAVAETMLPAHPGRTILADKGYVSAPLAAALWDTAGVRLLAVRRANQHQQWPPTLRRLLTRFRQISETVNQQLADQFTIEQTGARSFSGLCARVYTKLTAHTLCLYRNRMLGRPDWLQIKAMV
jgi:hypothetical protein